MSIAVADVVKTLCKMGITGISIIYDEEKDIILYDLNTQAKSHLWLSEDFWVYGRYDYSNQIDSEQEMNGILEDLFWEFKDCIRGRDFYSHEWMELGVKLGLVEKKVTTHTTTEYI